MDNACKIGVFLYMNRRLCCIENNGHVYHVP